MGARHLIDDLRFETCFDGADTDLAPWSDWPGFCRERLLAVVDQVFDEFSPAGGPMHRLEHLEIDLGELPDTASPDEVLARLEDALRRELQDSFTGIAANQAAKVETLAPATAAHETLEYYLRNGLLPWNAPTSAPYALEPELLRAATENPGHLEDLLRTEERALERAIRQLSDRALIRLLRRFSESAPEVFPTATPQDWFAQLSRQAENASAETRFRIWETAFRQVLQGPPPGPAKAMRAGVASEQHGTASPPVTPSNSATSAASPGAPDSTVLVDEAERTPACASPTADTIGPSPENAPAPKATERLGIRLAPASAAASGAPSAVEAEEASRTDAPATAGAGNAEGSALRLSGNTSSPTVERRDMRPSIHRLPDLGGRPAALTGSPPEISAATLPDIGEHASAGKALDAPYGTAEVPAAASSATGAARSATSDIPLATGREFPRDRRVASTTPASNASPQPSRQDSPSQEQPAPSVRGPNPAQTPVANVAPPQAKSDRSSAAAGSRLPASGLPSLSDIANPVQDGTHLASQPTGASADAGNRSAANQTPTPSPAAAGQHPHSSRHPSVPIPGTDESYPHTALGQGDTPPSSQGSADEVPRLQGQAPGTQPAMPSSAARIPTEPAASPLPGMRAALLPSAAVAEAQSDAGKAACPIAPAANLYDSEPALPVGTWADGRSHLPARSGSTRVPAPLAEQNAPSNGRFAAADAPLLPRTAASADQPTAGDPPPAAAGQHPSPSGQLSGPILGTDESHSRTTRGQDITSPGPQGSATGAPRLKGQAPDAQPAIGSSAARSPTQPAASSLPGIPAAPLPDAVVADAKSDAGKAACPIAPAANLYDSEPALPVGTPADGHSLPPVQRNSTRVAAPPTEHNVPTNRLVAATAKPLQARTAAPAQPIAGDPPPTAPSQHPNSSGRLSGPILDTNESHSHATLGQDATSSPSPQGSAASAPRQKGHAPGAQPTIRSSASRIPTAPVTPPLPSAANLDGSAPALPAEGRPSPLAQDSNARVAAALAENSAPSNGRVAAAAELSQLRTAAPAELPTAGDAASTAPSRHPNSSGQLFAPIFGTDESHSHATLGQDVTSPSPQGSATGASRLKGQAPGAQPTIRSSAARIPTAPVTGPLPSAANLHDLTPALPAEGHPNPLAQDGRTRVAAALAENNAPSNGRVAAAAEPSPPRTAAPAEQPTADDAASTAPSRHPNSSGQLSDPILGTDESHSRTTLGQDVTSPSPQGSATGTPRLKGQAPGARPVIHSSTARIPTEPAAGPHTPAANLHESAPALPAEGRPSPLAQDGSPHVAAAPVEDNASSNGRFAAAAEPLRSRTGASAEQPTAGNPPLAAAGQNSSQAADARLGGKAVANESVEAAATSQPTATGSESATSTVAYWRREVLSRVRGEFAEAIERHAGGAADPERYYRRLLAALSGDAPIDPATIAAQSGDPFAAPTEDNSPPEPPPAATPAKSSEVALPTAAWVEQLMDSGPSTLGLVMVPLLADPSNAHRLFAAWPEELLKRLFARLRPDEFERFHPYAEAMTEACAWDEAHMRRQRMWRFLASALFPAPRFANTPDFVVAYANLLASEAPFPGDFRNELCAALSAHLAGSRTAQYIRFWLLGAKRGPQASNRQEAEHGDAVPGGIHIGNAGQVLVSPYLPRLFDMLGLLQEGRFASPEHARRACFLLQFVVDGRGEAAEHELALNKLLCGLDLRQPLETGIEIDERERSAIEGMLGAVIAHWQAIGNASVAGLRETFLQRTGTLSFSRESWKLKVEKKTVDILMERLPWGFSIIRHPWMAQPVTVEWL